MLFTSLKVFLNIFLKTIYYKASIRGGRDEIMKGLKGQCEEGRFYLTHLVYKFKSCNGFKKVHFEAE